MSQSRHGLGYFFSSHYFQFQFQAVSKLAHSVHKWHQVAKTLFHLHWHCLVTVNTVHTSANTSTEVGIGVESYRRIRVEERVDYYWLCIYCICHMQAEKEGFKVHACDGKRGVNVHMHMYNWECTLHNVECEVWSCMGTTAANLHRGLTTIVRMFTQLIWMHGHDFCTKWLHVHMERTARID